MTNTLFLAAAPIGILSPLIVAPRQILTQGLQRADLDRLPFSDALSPTVAIDSGSEAIALFPHGSDGEPTIIETFDKVRRSLITAVTDPRISWIHLSYLPASYDALPIVIAQSIGSHPLPGVFCITTTGGWDEEVQERTAHERMAGQRLLHAESHLGPGGFNPYYRTVVVYRPTVQAARDGAVEILRAAGQPTDHPLQVCLRQKRGYFRLA
jgi:hypothetical protein